MRPVLTFVAVLAALAAGCGGASGGGSKGPPPKFVAPDGPALGRLTTGSSWTYAVTDPTLGNYTKVVTVGGPTTVPGTAQAAVQVDENIPAYDTLAWHSQGDGIVLKWREEQRVGGLLTQTTTWSPGVMKTLALSAPSGWTWESDAVQTVTYPDGTPGTQKYVSYVWTVLSASERITEPAGTFDCIKVQRVNPQKLEKTKTYWIAAGIGKVREEDGTGVVEELSSYDLK